MSALKSKIRADFRREVFVRDIHRCRKCGHHSPRLDAHHIQPRDEMPGGGYVVENGISLCPECHLKAKWYYVTEHQEWEPGYHPGDLYALIGSSYEIARIASENFERKMNKL